MRKAPTIRLKIDRLIFRRTGLIFYEITRKQNMPSAKLTAYFDSFDSEPSKAFREGM